MIANAVNAAPTTIIITALINNMEAEPLVDILNESISLHASDFPYNMLGMPVVPRHVNIQMPVLPPPLDITVMYTQVLGKADQNRRYDHGPDY